MIANLSWTCHVCGKTRPDAKIGVWKKTGMVHGVRIQQNIRYCIDRPSCLWGAREASFIPDPPRGPAACKDAPNCKDAGRGAPGGASALPRTERRTP